jgi:hypothetical protein
MARFCKMFKTCEQFCSLLYEEIEAGHKAALVALAVRASVEPTSRPGSPMPDVRVPADVTPSTPTVQHTSLDGVHRVDDIQGSSLAESRRPLFLPDDDDAVSTPAPPPYVKVPPSNDISMMSPVARRQLTGFNTPRTPRRSYTPAVSSPLRSAFTLPTPLAQRKAYKHGSPSGLDSAIGGNSGVLDTEDVFGTPTSFAAHMSGINSSLGVRLDLGDAHVAGEGAHNERRWQHSHSGRSLCAHNHYQR